MMAAEIKMLQLCSKACQGLLRDTRNKKRQERIVPSRFQRELGPAGALMCTSDLQIFQKIYFYCFNHPVGDFPDSSVAETLSF